MWKNFGYFMVIFLAGLQGISAEQVERSGFIFIGPKAETIRLMGDKVPAKRHSAGWHKRKGSRRSAS